MSESEQHVIRLEGVRKVFLTDEVETHALDNINIEIDRGEYVSIAGPSGCGKSTLLSILGLLDTPTEGTYTLNNQTAVSLSLAQRARVRNREVGFIFQSFNLIGDLNVFENVELPLTYRGMRPAERRAARHRGARARRHGASRQAPARASCPAVSSSASPSPAQCAASRRSCSPTSPPATSTRRTAKR